MLYGLQNTSLCNEGVWLSGHHVAAHCLLKSLTREHQGITRIDWRKPSVLVVASFTNTCCWWPAVIIVPSHLQQTGKFRHISECHNLITCTGAMNLKVYKFLSVNYELRYLNYPCVFHICISLVYIRHFVTKGKHYATITQHIYWCPCPIKTCP